MSIVYFNRKTFFCKFVLQKTNIKQLKFLPLLFGALCENEEVCFAYEICVEEDVVFRDFRIYLQSFYI